MDDKTTNPARMIDGPHGPLALVRQEGHDPGLVWLGGYASDMRGTKAQGLAAYAGDLGVACTRFDYSGHGESAGAFEDGTISAWAADAAHVLRHETEGPQILVGSSMGAWIACLLLRDMPEKIAGLILIAPAPDFATELTPRQWPEDQWATLQRDGRIAIPSGYDDSVMIYTKAMFEDGARTRVLDRPLHAPCPVRILTGMADDVVPYAHAIRLAEHLDGPDISLTMVKGGDHRMSTPADMARLFALVDELVTR